MAYQLSYTVNLNWVPDGAGPMSVASAQTLGFSSTGGLTIQVPGGDTPATPVTSANLLTAATALGVQLGTQLTGQLGRIQGFATGQP